MTARATAFLILLLSLCNSALAGNDNYTLDTSIQNVVGVGSVAHTISGDNVVGPVQIDEGATLTKDACPGIPDTFGTEYRITSFSNAFSQLQNFLGQAQPGDAIVFPTGTYTERIQYTLWSAGNGTAGNPVYIISEDLHGANMPAGTARWAMEVQNNPNIVIAGFKGNWHFGINWTDNVRIACNHFIGNFQGDPEHDPFGDDEFMNIKPSGGLNSENFEFDNNIVDNYEGGIINQQCSGCAQNLNAHVHHNAFIDSAFTGGVEALFWGTSDAGVDEGRMYGVIENNYIRDWDTGNELIAIKSSANIFRYNCVKTSTGTISNRGAQENMVYSNWVISMGGLGGLRNSGEDSLEAFNFVYSPAGLKGGGYLTQYSRYNQNAYSPSDRGVFSYNVLSNGLNQSGSIVQVVNPNAGTQFITGSTVDASYFFNYIYSDGAVSDFTDLTGTVTEATFKATNTWDEASNIKVGSKLVPSTTLCFDEDLFDGPGQEGVTVVTPPTAIPLGAGVTISPPSWWD